MASIVAGIGASHSIMLMARLEDWPHFAEVDKERAKYYFDKAGSPTNYEALLAMAPKGLAEILRPEAMRARYERWQTGLSKLRNAVARIAPARASLSPSGSRVGRASACPVFWVKERIKIRQAEAYPTRPGCRARTAVR
jgi:hypothetical protein